MTYARRKTPAGIEAAHVSAPPRLRQSQIDRPFNHAPMQPERGFVAMVAGWIRP